MENRKFRPMIDRLYWSIIILTSAVMIPLTVLSFNNLAALIITVAVDLFVLYFFVSPLFGYVELREETVFIKFGLIMEREIPYKKIRGLEKERKFYSDSMLSLKNAFEHINIKYDTFDVVTISVKDNDEFIREIEAEFMRYKY